MLEEMNNAKFFNDTKESERTQLIAFFKKKYNEAIVAENKLRTLLGNLKKDAEHPVLEQSLIPLSQDVVHKISLPESSRSLNENNWSA